MVQWYAKVVCGVLISVAAVGVVPGGEAMQKCGGITQVAGIRFLQLCTPAKYLCRFRRFLAAKMQSLWFP